MYCKCLKDCFEQLSAYISGECTSYPLIVNTENYDDYQEIVNRLNADKSKRCVYVSDHIYSNGLPNIQEVTDIISGCGCYFVIGISQSVMLRGENVLDEQLNELFGLSIEGHAVILVSHCRFYLEKNLQRDIRLENRILFIDGERSPLPQIRLAATKEACAGLLYDDGIGSLIAHLERISDEEISKKPYITVVASFSPEFFRFSILPVSAFNGIYDVLIETYPDLTDVTLKKYGTDDQWSWLLSRLEGRKSFSACIVDQFGSTNALNTHLGDVLDSGDDKIKWLLWLALKVFGAQSNRYLELVLGNSESFADIEEHIYKDLLEIKYTSPFFNQYYAERKQLIAHLPENLPQVSSYCQLVGRHGRDSVFYLTDATENEEFTFMKIVDQYEWTDEDLLKAINHGFPELSLYMREFVFDQVNTRLPDQDNDLRGVLTDYFNRYKSQKIRNHIDSDFLDIVNKFAIDRPFYKLQPRSSILSGMDKKNTQGFFFDSLGVEYLSYIQAKCEQYGLIYEIHIAHCELPSITAKNKDFKCYFDTKDIGDLDELKHHSQIYDYRSCPYPIHIFRELEIIDKELLHIRAQLIQNTDVKKSVIISDHGASRLAVIYQHENQSPLRLDEKGEHSGRCCPSEKDPQIPGAVYDDGYAVLGNYERFKGGRRANLEVHGGASLEEVIVPILAVSLRPDDIVYYFVDPVIIYKIGKPSEIELFSNSPMVYPRLLIDGVFYDGIFQNDKNHALFTMAELKRVREYKAVVYEGNTNTGVELTFRIERNTKVRDLFGK